MDITSLWRLKRENETAEETINEGWSAWISPPCNRPKEQRRQRNDGSRLNRERERNRDDDSHGYHLLTATEERKRSGGKNDQRRMIFMNITSYVARETGEWKIRQARLGREKGGRRVVTTRRRFRWSHQTWNSPPLRLMDRLACIWYNRKEDKKMEEKLKNKCLK